MVPLIEEEVVNKKKWLSQEDFIDLLAVSQSVPGVFAVNLSIFIGNRGWNNGWMAKNITLFFRESALFEPLHKSVGCRGVLVGE